MERLACGEYVRDERDDEERGEERRELVYAQKRVCAEGAGDVDDDAAADGVREPQHDWEHDHEPFV